MTTSTRPLLVALTLSSSFYVARRGTMDASVARKTFELNNDVQVS